MKRKGLIFLDIIIGLFIIGLVIVVSFPIFNLTNESFKKSKDTTEMIYISEATIESLKSKDQVSLDFLENLEKKNSLEYPYLEDDKYISRVELLDENEDLWFLNVRVGKKNDEGGIEYVEIEATIPK